MQIRLANKNDFEKYFLIKQKFYTDYEISTKTKAFIFKEFTEFLKKIFILAEDHGELIAYLQGEIEKNAYETYGYMSELFVKNEYRRKGTSSKLKDKFIDILKERNIHLCRLDVNPDNQAMKAYTKWGFKIDKYRMSLKI